MRSDVTGQSVALAALMTARGDDRPLDVRCARSYRLASALSRSPMMQQPQSHSDRQ